MAQQHYALERDVFVWALGAMSQLHRIPFDAELMLREFPPPYDLASLQQAFVAIDLEKRNMTLSRFFGVILLGVCFAVTQLTHARTEAEWLRMSYKERQDPRLSKRGPLDADPNVYVYTAEFAKRFQMPEEWVLNELKGLDAVAFRVVPSYKWCGWGGDPKPVVSKCVVKWTCTLTTNAILCLGMRVGPSVTRDITNLLQISYRTEPPACIPSD